MFFIIAIVGLLSASCSSTKKKEKIQECGSISEKEFEAIEDQLDAAIDKALEDIVRPMKRIQANFDRCVEE